MAYTDLHTNQMKHTLSDLTQSVLKPAISSGDLLEMQNLRPCPDQSDQNLHLFQEPRIICVHIQVWDCFKLFELKNHLKDLEKLSDSQIFLLVALW